MLRVEQRQVDRLLQVEAVMDAAQEQAELPLLLLVAARRAEGEAGLAVLEGDRGRQRRARALAGRERGGQAFFQPEHLGAGIQREAEFRDDRRGLHPAARGRRRDHVAPFVDDVDMDGVALAAGRDHRGHGRLADASAALGRLGDGAERPHRMRDLRLVAGDDARPQLQRGALADQPAPSGRIILGEQGRQRHLHEIRVAVIGLAIGEGELHRLDDMVDEFGTGRAHPGEIDAFEDLQRLQEGRTLAPRADLEDLPVVIGHGGRRLIGRLVIRHVLRGQQALVAAAGGIHHLLRAAEAVHRLGDEALVPGVIGALDLLLPVAALGFSLGEDALVGLGRGLVGEELARLRHVAAGQVDRARCRPFIAEEVGQLPDRIRDARQHRVAVLEIADRGFENVAQLEPAMVAQQRHPAAEGAGNDGGEQARARDQVEAERLIGGDGGRLRSRALRAERLDLPRFSRIEHGWHVAGRSDEMRLHHLQHEGGGGAGVEGVAALFQHRHARGGGEPVGRRHDTEGAEDFGAGREHGRIPEA